MSVRSPFPPGEKVRELGKAPLALESFFDCCKTQRFKVFSYQLFLGDSGTHTRSFRSGFIALIAFDCLLLNAAFTHPE